MIERRRQIIQKTQEPVQPLTFTALANSSRVSVNVNKNITSVSYFEVSKNGGAWQRYNKQNKTALSFAIVLSAGDYCQIRGQNIALNSSTQYNTIIRLEGNIEVSGNIATLYHPKGMLPSQLSYYGSAFYKLFYNSTGLTSAENLILPQPVGEYCYSSLFDGCSYLTIAPTIPDFTLTESCLKGMFSGCARLAQVTVLLSQQPSETYTYKWFDGVNTYGTFIKNPSATWDRTGVSGVPTRWTITDYQE